MKRKLIYLLLASCVFISCEKESNKGDVSFNSQFARLADTTMYDSVAFLVMDYAKTSLIENEYYDDPNAIIQSVSLPIDKSNKESHFFSTNYLNLDAGVYLIKKFDLTSNAGRIIYHIPSVYPENYTDNLINNIMLLPAIFTVENDYKSSFNFVVVKNEI